MSAPVLGTLLLIIIGYLIPMADNKPCLGSLDVSGRPLQMLPRVVHADDEQDVSDAETAILGFGSPAPPRLDASIGLNAFFIKKATHAQWFCHNCDETIEVEDAVCEWLCPKLPFHAVYIHAGCLLAWSATNEADPECLDALEKLSVLNTHRNDPKTLKLLNDALKDFLELDVAKRSFGNPIAESDSDVEILGPPHCQTPLFALAIKATALPEFWK